MSLSSIRGWLAAVPATAADAPAAPTDDSREGAREGSVIGRDSLKAGPVLGTTGIMRFLQRNVRAERLPVTK
jgi:hypothetical protein